MLFRSHRSVLPDTSQAQTLALTPVVTRRALLDLAVSFANKRVVFFEQVNRTISATFLDGSDHVTLRPDVGFLHSVQSLAYEKDLFLLTNGWAVYQEVKQGNVFNEFLVDCDIWEPSQSGFDNVRVSSSSSQPHPVPRRPRALEVVFGASMASVTWETPALRTGASKDTLSDVQSSKLNVFVDPDWGFKFVVFTGTVQPLVLLFSAV